MPFQIVRNDIADMNVDALVNTANPNPAVGSGVDSRIHQKAGRELLEARKIIGKLSVGEVAITPGYNLRARNVIHVCGPVWRDGGHREAEFLRECYDRALLLAVDNGCESIAFPLISSGNYGFPKDVAMEVALAAISSFLMKYDMEIYLVVYDSESVSISEKLVTKVQSYIDDKYVDEHKPLKRYNHCIENQMLASIYDEAMAPQPVQSLEELMKNMEDSFRDALIKWIDRRGWKDSYVYKKANISKQLFNKIINNPNYKTSKKTAILLAMGLELNLDETKELIGRAGFALSKSNKTDIVVEYFITTGNYNVMELDMVLFDLGLETIAS